jgi:hypothetical protein
VYVHEIKNIDLIRLVDKVKMTMRRIVAAILLALLLAIPFIDWRLGAVMWMSAWLVFILQKLFSRQEWKLGDGENDALNDQADEEGNKD